MWKIAVVLDMMQLSNLAASLPHRTDVGNLPSKSEKRSKYYMWLEQLPAK